MEFYIAETVKNNWSVRQLERHFISFFSFNLLFINYFYIRLRSINAMYTYTLSLEDLLTILIYDFSTDPKKVKRRTRSVWIIVTCFALIGIANYLIKDFWLSGIFLAIALLFLFFGDRYLKFAYKKSFKKAIKNNLSGMLESPIQVIFESDHIHVIDKTGDSNFKFSQILWINEITGYFIIKLSNGHALGIPKINETLKNDIESIVSANNLPYQSKLDWKW